jgi:hypothetical protein
MPPTSRHHVPASSSATASLPDESHPTARSQRRNYSGANPAGPTAINRLHKLRVPNFGRSTAFPRQ